MVTRVVAAPRHTLTYPTWRNCAVAPRERSTSSRAAALSTPLCKTYVHDCTYSKYETRAYTYGPNAAITADGQGYDINWVLSEVAPLRNSLGTGPVMDDDLLAAGVPPVADIWDPPAPGWQKLQEH